MSIKDNFKYESRWGSVGLDCSICKHVKPVNDWPIKSNEYYCQYHKTSLSMQINNQGYKEGEWFCSKFTNNGKANEHAYEEFNKIKQLLKDDVLYGLYGKNGYLKEVTFFSE